VKRLNALEFNLLLFSFVFILFLASGCSQKKDSPPLKDGMTELHVFINTIEDKARQRKLHEIVNEMEESLRKFHRTYQSVQVNLQTLNDDYDAKRESFEAEFARLESEQIKMQQSVLNNYFQMKDFCQPGEWKEIREMHHESAMTYLKSKEL